MNTLTQLINCRTSVLGGHSWSCQDCGAQHVAYNSCRNRHCPGCGGPERGRWLEQMLAWQLPVHYFHLVFTVPHELSKLMLGNRRPFYGLLFRAASAALLEMASDPKHLGATPGFVMVLHTWGQQLDHHPHVHMVATGGGLSLDGQRWISSSPKYFLDVVALGHRFRDKFMAGMNKLYAAGDLKFTGSLSDLMSEDSWHAVIESLMKHEWVVHCEAAPEGCDGPEAAIKYLARYVAGIAISDHRLVADDGRRVTISYKDYKDGRKQKLLTLDGQEFVRRFMLHILPKGLVRVRYGGLLAHVKRQQNLRRCRELLKAKEESADVDTERRKEQQENIEDKANELAPRQCRVCGGTRLQYLGPQARPSWHYIYVRSLTCQAYIQARRRVHPPAPS